MSRFLVVGDAPNQPTGLARIARDISTLLRMAGHEVAVLGWGYDGSPQPWACYGIADGDNWGQGDFNQVMNWVEPDVVFTVWDPARCWPITTEFERRKPHKVKLWGYFAVDGHNPQGRFGGPAAVALNSYDRVLAYGRYGARVLKAVLEHVESPTRVQWLPHLLAPAFHEVPEGRPEVWFRQGLTVGCVASNQPRKDLALTFGAVAELEGNLWLHVDIAIKTWAVAELAEVYGFDPSRCIVTHLLTDEELALRYAACDVTIAPGLGEGFGYPIIESFAAGTPVVHGSYAGGAELLPSRLLVEPVAMRVEGTYALQRPVFAPEDFALALGRAADWKANDPACAPYLRGLVAYLRWENLAPWWLAWIKEGLNG